MPIQKMCVITEIKKLSDAVYSINLEAGDLASMALPGQFIHVKCGEHLLLRRPISICDVSGENLTMVFEVKGEGTRWLSERKAAEKLDILGPLGKGFDLSGKHIIVVGGGIGVPPMLYAAKSSSGIVTAILGFRDKEKIMLTDKFEAVCKEVDITTDDGSFGEHGFVTEPLRRRLQLGGYDMVLSCGPKAMLKSVAAVCFEYQIPCQVSLEERMGCGVGACLVCACRTNIDGTEQMSHVCKDGPVFNASEVVW